MRKLALLTLSILAVAQIAKAQMNADVFRLNFPSTKSYEQGKPLLSPNGDELFFVSSYRAGDEKVVSQNIWKTSWNDKISALEPQMVKDLSNNDNNAIIGFDTKTNVAYLLGTYSKKENLKKGLSTASISGNQFSKPAESKIKALMIKGDLYDFHKPNNSDVIFMALPNSKDLISIYVSFPNEKNGWSKPVILSQISNEANTEISPYFDELEGYLYFASNRAGGLGGMDIYRSKKQDDSWMNWGAPELLPEPINSTAFDAYYAAYGEKGSFLVSTRQDSLSSIYHIKYKEVLASPEITLDDEFNLEGTNEGIFEYNNLPNANATLKLYDLDGNLVEETITNENGEFVFKKLDPDKKYLIKYLTEDGNFDPSKATISAFDKSKYSALKPITAEMQKDGMTDGDLISGIFKYDKLPKPGVEVVLLDEDGNVLSRTLTDANGYYEFSNLDPDKVYLVRYLDEDGTLDPNMLGVYPAESKAEMSETPEQKLLTTPEKPDEQLEIKVPVMPQAAESANISLVVHFDFNKTEPIESDWLELKEQLSGLDKGIRLKIDGHTDNIGSNESNINVALLRAKSIKAKIVAFGFDETLISVNSHGESIPKVPNNSAENRALNRRVEIKIQ
jgi:outer membrane protein OmpA-like peptidoglycan-associated protein